MRKSHIECIQIAKNNGWDHVLIFEDDALFIHPEVLVHQVSSFLSRFRDEWDVVLFSGNNYPPFKIEAPDCFRIANCQTTGCYLVCSRYYDTLLRNFEERARGARCEPRKCVCICVRCVLEKTSTRGPMVSYHASLRNPAGGL